MIDNDTLQLIQSSNMKSGNNWGTGILLVKDGKILFDRRIDTKELCTPGGKVEVGESPTQGIVRETSEEENIKINTLICYDYALHTCPKTGKNWVSFMFLSNDFDDSNMKPQETEMMGEYYWLTLDEALERDDLFPPTRKSLIRAKNTGLLSEDSDYNSIPFVESPKNASECSDSCCCAYSWMPPEEIFI